jgi:hypothetical protein
MSTSFPKDVQDSVDSLYAAAEDAVSRAHHIWDAQQVFKVTSGVAIVSKIPSILGIPVTDQDLFEVGCNSILK